MAIQVNGTEVISNSRALNNIASVDATTVAAMGAAGVGGATKLITANTSLGTASTYSFPLTTRYREHIIAVFGIQHTGNNDTEVRSRLTDTSNNPISGASDYYGLLFNHSINRGGVADFAALWTELNKVDASYNGRVNFIINIKNAHTSAMPTTIEFNVVAEYFNSFQNAATGTYMRTANEVNNAFYLYTAAGYNLQNGYYSMWGVDV